MQFSERNNTQDVPLEFCQSALRSKRPAEKRRSVLAGTSGLIIN